MLTRVSGVCLSLFVFSGISAVPAAAQTLEGFAKFGADTFAPGPTSGQFITGNTNGRTPPFVDQQPVQGISSVLAGPGSDFWLMPDNGFGAQDNSADYLLRLYRVAPRFKTRDGGPGTIDVKKFITLRDPAYRIPFQIVADLELYPNSAIPVDPGIRQHRWLTGADFDIESVRVGTDGSLWFGDEFGPFLIHTDATGKVLDAPYSLPGVRSPQNPFLGSRAATLPRSKGFEGMAIARDDKFLYPMLEGALIDDPDQQHLIISEFNIRKRQYTNNKWAYHLETAGNSIGDFTAVTDRTFLVIERDNFEGAAAAFKKIFLVDFDQVDSDGFLIKKEVADLLNIRDPRRLGGTSAVFRFPFQTIESVIPLDRRHIGVLNDNNYPFSAGRTPGEADPNEFIILRLEDALPGFGRYEIP